MIESWDAMMRERLSPKRADQVTLDTLRAGRAVDRANKAIEKIEDDSILRARLRLIERRRQQGGR